MKQFLPAQAEYLLGRPVIQFDDTIVNKQVLGQVVLITGAAGSIGSELVRQLLCHKPRQIVLLDQAESALYDLLIRLSSEPESDGLLTGHIADITDAVRMRHVFARYQPDIVFHTAAYKHVPLMEEHPYEAVKTNVLGTKVVADLAVHFSVQKFVLISTDKAVNPTSVMGATKRLAEMYVQSLNATSSTHFIITRFGNVLDSAGSVVPLFKRQIEAGGPVTVTHPDISRYFMTIPEACQLVLEAVALGYGGEVFVFDMGQPVRIVDLVCRLVQLSGYEVNKEIKLRFTGLRPGEKLHEDLLSADACCLPTDHPKIKKVRLLPPDTSVLQEAVVQLKLALSDADDTALVRILKEYIPDYVSKNSPYAHLNESLNKVSAA
ncbi:polysaccharide biosynthesis protein [Spirosoma sp. RP8]|uniref:Polysaccharide biosynthesis protein n=1 Tax=Spirosoma liriopis TaxID=2937440 RepID=A0ABT0HH16_9BACT|nr:UDP-N-acetylglucosamine 4,6-dehydratase family protein [Spirosoma liriopis]MCK8491444.1 polysaccharide biosynthesis protein [Spirosoma liriopis]